MTEQEKYLLVKGTAGMGNRLVSVLTALLYARLSGRSIHIDWSDPGYSNDGTNVFPDFFTGKQRDLLVDIPETDSVHPAVWRGHLSQPKHRLTAWPGERNKGSPSHWARTSADPARLDYPERVLVMWAYAEQVYRMRKFFPERAPEYRGRSTPYILRSLFQEELALAPALTARLDSLKASLLARPTIGLHVRYSDKRSRLSLMRKRLDALCKQHPEMQLFVATDNEHILKQFQREYADVVSVPKWYPPPGLPMHRWSDGQDPRQHGVDALMDLFLLAACDYMVTDESSTFAAAVRWVTERPADRVVNVYRHPLLPPYVRHWVWLAKRTVAHRLGWRQTAARRSVHLSRKEVGHV